MRKIIYVVTATLTLALCACSKGTVVREWEGQHAGYSVLVEETKERVGVILSSKHQAVQQRPSRISADREGGTWIRISIDIDPNSYCSWFANKDGDAWRISSPLCPQEQVPHEMQGDEAIGELILLVETTIDEIKKTPPRVFTRP